MSRRSVLCGVLVALAVPGGLAACSSGSTPSGTTTGGGTTPGGGTTTPAGPPIIAALADVPDGGGMIAGNPANSKPLVLVRTGDTVKAYDATCPHQGCATSSFEDGARLSPDGRTFVMVRRSPAARIIVLQNLPAIVRRLQGRGPGGR